ncbi:hypothetical protein [Nitrosopumilus sp. Nsub]|uniref:hypothetical protein n=1 Tax=Nitrosopumilus sp. Nsub TaxID=1776294 RepID=UPI00082A93CD|nr:hypothetical protein [Nitrosopumilus sp. Nsub]
MTFHKYLADSKMFEYDKHYKECQQQNKPFIKSKINPVHGNYTVNVDLMSCNYVFSKPELNEIKQLIDNEKSFVNSNYSNLHYDYTIDEEVIWIDGVSIENMGFVCTSIYDLAQKFHD